MTISEQYLEMRDMLDEAICALEEMTSRKNAAYRERNRVVAALAHCFPSGIRKTSIQGWSDDWHNCVYIDLPSGQVSWHYHDSEVGLFKDLPPYEKEWDGHTTEQKYERLAKLSTPKFQNPLERAYQLMFLGLESLWRETGYDLAHEIGLQVKEFHRFTPEFRNRLIQLGKEAESYENRSVSGNGSGDQHATVSASSGEQSSGGSTLSEGDRSEIPG